MDMNKIIILILCLGIFVAYCFPIKKNNSNERMKQTIIVEDSLLNETEGIYLNGVFGVTRKDFNFINKKVGFLTGSSGKTMGSKNYYFDMQEKHSINKNSPIDNGSLYIFDAKQKEASGGYDAAIIYWSKLIISIDEVIERLRGKP
jgi:hypothetical protein